MLALSTGRSVNRTIDDVHGDSATGIRVQYLPNKAPTNEGSLWINRTSCAGCTSVPDSRFAIQNTWSAARYTADIGSMSVGIKFSGRAIYVFFILPNFDASSGLVGVVRCNFFIDGVAVGKFTHDSDDSNQFAYNVLVYQNTTITDGDHVLLIKTTGTDPAIIIFDYALYTYDA
ncbi:hypothetical protein B0H15DRAFT_787340 [Mycena belliarum]|uniref:Uncharacterized protein n=1 Tax=Mycena belliarum TaxID=1033014 RepID=A0AAD6TUV9_9AGAR|nr:hypothetical protein B0H15DRAFT_787340 [Mycena belliae]